jgi:hypothetical protein
MRMVDNVVLQDAIFEEQFVCDLGACKGACCVDGEGGAPLAPHEALLLAELYPALAPHLTEAGREAIAELGTAVFDGGEYETPLVGDGGPCAYVVYDAIGTAKCGIEKAYTEGVVDFRKPISCHLYPIRVEQQPGGLELAYYHKWHICSAACTNGQRLKVPVYQFLKDALVRKYGAAFYEALEALAQHTPA